MCLHWATHKNYVRCISQCHDASGHGEQRNQDNNNNGTYYKKTKPFGLMYSSSHIQTHPYEHKLKD